jgi:hypothetical protein
MALWKIILMMHHKFGSDFQEVLWQKMIYNGYYKLIQPIKKQPEKNRFIKE